MSDVHSNRVNHALETGTTRTQIYPQCETFSDVLLERARETPDGKYMLLGEEWLTFADVAHSSERVAAGLQQLGVKQGDHVAVILPNSKEFVLFYFACSRLGAVMVPLNIYLRGSFLSHQMVESQAKVVVTDHDGLKQVGAVMGDLRDLRGIIVTDDAEFDGAPLPLRTTPFAELLAETTELRLPRISPDDLQGIIYTSGTTGMPKGCMFTHRALMYRVRTMIEYGYFAGGDRMITSFPMFYNGGYAYALGISLVGEGSLVLEAKFSASTFIDRARQTDATILFGMGAMALAILAQPPKPNDRNHKLRLAFMMPLKPDHQIQIMERFGIADLYGECYGHTEIVPVSLSRVGGPRKRDSAGKVLPYFEVRIADDADNAVPVGEIGEILVRHKSPGIMFSGYWNNPTATLATWRNLWHHTGDCGRIDEDGFLYFADRKKDAIRRRGQYISSMELEQALLKNPDIALVAAHAVASELTEDEIKIWIVPAEGRTIEPRVLFEYCRKVLPYYAMPRYVELASELPCTAGSLRVEKHELKQRPNTETTWDMEKMGLVIGRDERRS